MEHYKDLLYSEQGATVVNLPYKPPKGMFAKVYKAFKLRSYPYIMNRNKSLQFIKKYYKP